MPQDSRAYALKETIKDFAGGSVTLPPTGRTLDVKARLNNGNGVIVTNDDNEIAALEAYPALKSVPVPKADSKTKGSDA